ncbi:MAG TPA: hypothetical protein VKT82_30850 [Ktedonobacterales bacterium]|nr:hypothetical protein [Ktedonobacterales bacterium]
MANEETDKLHLVEKSTVRGGWFGRTTIAPADDFCLVVFRGDTRLGTLLSRSAGTQKALNEGVSKLNARDGDTIFRINLGPQQIEVNGTVKTRDGFERVYRSLVELSVTNIPAFVSLYRQGSDPVKMAAGILRSAYQGYANSKDHDRMDETQMPFQLKPALSNNSRTGLSVSAVYALSLDPDPHLQRLRDIARETEVEEAKKGQQATLGGLDRAEDFRQFIHEQDKDKVRNTAAQRKIVQDAAAEATAQLVRQEILSGGRHPGTVLEEYGVQQDTFSLPEQTPAAAIGSGRPGAEPAKALNEASMPMSDPNPVARAGAEEPVINHDLGLELTWKELKPEECEKAGLPERSQAYQVTDILDGPAARDGIQGLDYLLQINEKPLQDADSITSLLFTGAPGESIKLLILRKGAPKPLTLPVTL